MRLVFLLFAMALPEAVAAQEFDGIYRPDEAWAEDWSCDPGHLGSDGGSVGIIDGRLIGIESSCQLTDPHRVESGVRYQAVCSSEGDKAVTGYVIKPTSNGITLTREGRTVAWRRCDQPNASGVPANTWVQGFAMGTIEASTGDSLGNSIMLSCQDGADGKVWIELGGHPVAGREVILSVDGNEFSFMAWADGGRLNVECSACMGNYMALQSALRTGNRVTIRQGNAVAMLGLRGSAAAIWPQDCQPEGF